MFLLTLKCQNRELRGRVTVREENCDKTARCTFKCWIVARNEQKSRALPRKRERGADVPKWVLFRGLPSTLQLHRCTLCMNY